MAEWTACPACGLKHSPRESGLCPRCGARLAGGEPLPGADVPPAPPPDGFAPAADPGAPAPSPGPSPPPLARQAARASWAAPLTAMVLAALVRGANPLAGDALVMLLAVAGLAAGVVALAGLPRHGTSGLLLPAIVGLVLNLALCGIFASNYLASRVRAAPPAGSAQAARPGPPRCSAEPPEADCSGGAFAKFKLVVDRCDGSEPTVLSETDGPDSPARWEYALVPYRAAPGTWMVTTTRRMPASDEPGSPGDPARTWQLHLSVDRAEPVQSYGRDAHAAYAGFLLAGWACHDEGLGTYVITDFPGALDAQFHLRCSNGGRVTGCLRVEGAPALPAGG